MNLPKIITVTGLTRVPPAKIIKGHGGTAQKNLKNLAVIMKKVIAGILIFCFVSIIAIFVLRLNKVSTNKNTEVAKETKKEAIKEAVQPLKIGVKSHNLVKS